MNLSTSSSFRLVFVASGLVAALASVHCGMSSQETSNRFDDPQATGFQDAGSLGATADGGRPSDLMPTAPNGEARGLASGLLLVNATRTFPAFRVCPTTDGTSSQSYSAPQPTTLMPQSSLAGVDVNGAAQIEPQADFAGQDRVLVLRVDEQTKGYESLVNGNCRTLACTTGTGCIGAGKIEAVPVRNTNGTPAFGAFAGTGKILALREDVPGDLHFEVIPIANTPSESNGTLRVEYRNISEYKGNVTFRRGDGGVLVMDEEESALVNVAGDYAGSRFTAGQTTASLIDIHQASNPRAAIDSFYASPGSFALILVGLTGAGADAGDGGVGRGLRFLAVPVSPTVKPDGGAADASAD